MDFLVNMTMTSTRWRTAHAVLVAVMIAVAGARAEGTAADFAMASESIPEPTCAVTVGGLPASILMPHFLVASMERMVQASATLRSQCNRTTGTPGVYIRVHVDRGMERRAYRARSVIHRAGSGAIVALVDIGPRAVGSNGLRTSRTRDRTDRRGAPEGPRTPWGSRCGGQPATCSRPRGPSAPVARSLPRCAEDSGRATIL